jgi:dienelactone hydrolase
MGEMAGTLADEGRRLELVTDELHRLMVGDGRDELRVLNTFAVDLARAAPLHKWNGYETEIAKKAGADLAITGTGHAPKRFDYAGRLDGVTAFLGCHERDPHIPLARVRESQAVLEGLGAKVTAQIYPGAGHGVTEEEVRYLRRLLNQSSLNPGVRS